MAKWKVLITDGLDENGKEILRRSVDVTDQPGISADDLLKVVGDFDALIVRGRTKVTAAVFDAGKKLKAVGRAGVGVDNIDLVAAKSKGVTVVNSPLATTTAVAELTLSMMLSVVREIPRADASMKAGKWLKKELERTELGGRTLGLVGIGRIAREVAARAKAFGMHVIAYDKYVAQSDAAEMVSLDEVYARSDYISLHTPLTDETRGMICAATIAKMKNATAVRT